MEHRGKKITESQATILALQNLMMKRLEIERSLERDRFELMTNYRSIYDELSDQVKVLIQGKPVHPKERNELLSMIPDDVSVDEYIGVPPENNKLPGLKNYWYRVLKNHPRFRTAIKAVDRPILRHLIDIRSIYISPDCPSPDYPDKRREHGLMIEFHFEPNKYFSNEVIYKYYQLGFDTDVNRDCDYTTFDIIDIDPSIIHWNPGKDVTLAKHEYQPDETGVEQDILSTKPKKRCSFFDLFLSPGHLFKLERGRDASRSMIDDIMWEDYDSAVQIHNDLIPRSILYYMNKKPRNEFEEHCIYFDACSNGCEKQTEHFSLYYNNSNIEEDLEEDFAEENLDESDFDEDNLNFEAGGVQTFP